MSRGQPFFDGHLGAVFLPAVAVAEEVAVDEDHVGLAGSPIGDEADIDAARRALLGLGRAVGPDLPGEDDVARPLDRQAPLPQTATLPSLLRSKQRPPMRRLDDDRVEIVPAQV